MKNAIIFLGGRKTEKIYVGDQELHLPIGGLICELMDLSLINLILCTDHAKDFLREILHHQHSPESISEIPKMFHPLSSQPTIKTLLHQQPLLAHLSVAETEVDELNYTDFEWAQFECAYHNSYRKEQAALLSRTSYPSWLVFSDYLNGHPAPPIETPREREAFDSCLRDYSKCLERTVFDIKRLKQNLKNILGTNPKLKDLEIEPLLQNLYRVGLLPQSLLHATYPKEKNNHYTHTYIATNLPQLVALELDLIDRSNRLFAHCKVCGKIFVPYKGRGVYCHRKNPSYNNRTCSDVGPEIAYGQKIATSPHYALYSKNSKAYKKWCRDNICSIDDNATIKQINDNYKAWKKQAQQALKASLEGALAQPDLLLSLTPPSIPERSALLYELKQYY